MKKTICVDFDGVIHSYTSGWQGADVIDDPPVPGAIMWITLIVEHPDIAIVIYSSRSSQVGGIDAMKEWLARFGMPSETIDRVEFPTKKPAAYLTIDDRCFRFEGDFPSMNWIENFKPWNRWKGPGGV